MKFLMNVGAEKAGTSWFYKYFESHPDFISCGKELNIIERDTFVPTLTKSYPFKKDLKQWFAHIKSLDKPTGDFTHYEGSSENVYRLFKDGLADIGIDVVPVYIMRDPIARAWSCWNMFYDYIYFHKRTGWARVDPTKASIIENISNVSSRYDFNMHPIAQLFVGSYLTPEYKRTIEALDSVFDEPLYFFYEQLFDQTNIDLVCDRLDIARKPINTESVNKGTYEQSAPREFIEAFCKTKVFKENVAFVNERFNNVPWSIKDYEEIAAKS
jgi:hypothetical protein